MHSFSEDETSLRCRIRDHAFENGRTGFAWGIGNSLMVFPQASKERRTRQQGQRNAGYLHDVCWSTSLYNRVMRQLVNESSSVFLDLQNFAAEIKGETAHPSLVTTSRSYRATLNVCWNSCEDEMESVDEDSRLDFYAKYELLRNIEHIWHLCEILFLDVQPGTAYLQQLQRWVQSRSLLEARMEELFREDEPHLSPDYWDHVYMLVLQASLEDVRRLLKRHPCSGREDFVLLDELLQSAPQGSPQVASRELHVWWQTWQAQCARHLADGDFSLLPEMEVVCKILMGDKDTLKRLRELCKTWYNYLVTLVTYTRPTDEPQMLADLAEDCLTAFGGLESTRGMDSILLAAFRFDLPQVIQEASLFLDNWWFSAHLSDLLFHAGQMEASHAEYASELREHLILEYAASLMTHHSLWQVGVGYLDHCPRRGREYLEAFIEHIPLKTQAQALKVVEILEQREMPAVKDICQTLAVRMAKKGQLGIALTWAMRCKNPVLTSRLADQFLAEYSERRELPCLDMLENMGESMLFSDRLTFLANYREFQRKPPGQAAARLLTDLIDSQLAPHFLWPRLLRDAIHTLSDSTELLLDTNQVVQLLSCLEAVSAGSTASGNPIEVPESQQNWTKAEEKELRRLLSHHLVNALTKETTTLSP
ncbi:nuclear pore complex protein Nup85 isoform X1 [Rhipicephalus sanguineus]|uniref:nuclear pore complex protein Nup85 isoform X1 n=1 Tax=Rhipicephalus sanguineus TaxID=34632 RepID=UPI0018940416|nr:nuclear pore complex protein Nup85 isoform X1 [Rhipicephalus sanguineus]